MKYLEPNIEIIILADCDTPLTSNVEVGDEFGDMDNSGLPDE